MREQDHLNRGCNPTTLSKISSLPQFPELSRIREIRKKLNISQRELAMKAGVSQSLIAKIEGNNIDPSFRGGNTLPENRGQGTWRTVDGL